MDGPGAAERGMAELAILSWRGRSGVIKAKTVDAMQFNSKPRQQKEGKDRMNKELLNIQDTHRHEELAQQSNFVLEIFRLGPDRERFDVAIQKQFVPGHCCLRLSSLAFKTS